MTHPALALQAAVRAALIADSGVGALVGDRIYDEPPRGPTFPYVSFGEARASDWSTGTETGAEHRLVLNVWSRHRGKAECWAIVEALQAILDDAALTLDGHRLINLRFETADVRRDRDRITWTASVRFRAVTEPL
ncbi:DUF3168 domain-containing protein [Bauldia sp.]|uniref:DUF3168 domain-containing protein n=1 Tax=Bauldia sp. TaxID=2575872 RepID=UPI003BA99091